MHLSSVDLDLLVALHALVETESVTAASRQLSLSRSATSHALARLRELFGDELLVRSGRGLVRTPRAERIRPALAKWVGDTELLLTDTPTFEPSTARRAFRIGTNDYTEQVLVAPLSQRICEIAPGIDVFSMRVGEGTDALRSGEVDLLLGAPGSRPADLRVGILYEERHVCLLREGHEALEQPLTAERFAELRHVLVAPRGTPTGVMDARLQQAGLRRRVARTVATYSVAPLLVAGSDHVLTLPERMARPMAALLGLAVVEAPFDVRFPIGMCWHQRTSADPAHSWLRAVLHDVAQSPDTPHVQPMGVPSQSA